VQDRNKYEHFKGHVPQSMEHNINADVNKNNLKVVSFKLSIIHNTAVDPALHCSQK